MQIDDLARRFWDLRMAAAPTWANLLGDHRFDDQIEDVSLAAEDHHIAALHAVINDARAIDPPDRTGIITRELLIHEATSDLLDGEGRLAEFLVDPMIGPHVSLPSFAPQRSIVTADHANATVDRYRKVAGLFDQAGERLRQGVAHGRTPPRVNVEKSLAQLDRYLESQIENDPWLKVKAPAEFSPGEVATWKEQLRRIVTDSIRPAFDRYRTTIREEVAPLARTEDQVGICWLPDGDELYEKAILKYTSLPLTAGEIHQIGLETMAALGDEYRELGEGVLGTTTLPEIYDRLRTDPALRFESAQEIVAKAERAVSDAEAAVPGWFGMLPAQSCEVKEIPELEAKEAPLAYYLPPATDGSRAGAFFINTLVPEEVARYEAEALAFHEGVPGHHLQVAIAQGLGDLPEFRKHGLLYSYVEGWGLYTERLADEMGLYSGDLERMGMLSYDSWRAGRLVVDTGMHAMGWSRTRAVDYLTEHTPQQLASLDNEVDRYIGYFGQALSYMIGRREIMRLRKTAKASLGSRFEIRGFHDTVLGSGPLTLPLLGSLVDEWVGGTQG